MGVDEIVEVLQVVLVKGIANDLDVQLVQILVAQTTLEVGGQRGLDQYRVIQFLDVCRDTQYRKCLEPS